ncbi:OmpA family protein [Inquilinus sp.]|uniref:OmpA family protein n=1 Tax=Inquilinus sp. TaxID=1932117 RepID=UPI0031DBA3A8
MRLPMAIGMALALAGCAQPGPEGIIDYVHGDNARSYIVGFQPGSAKLDKESVKVVTDAATDAVKYHAALVVITGHADRVGPKDQNQELSRRRALAVRRLMESEGVNRRIITVKAAGEDDQLVPTDDNVPAPTNRNAEIIIR